MNQPLYLLAYVGATQIIIALILAWIMVGTSHFKIPFLVTRVKTFRDLVKAHLDYLLMALFTLCFFVLYKSTNMEPSWTTVLLVSFGSMVNPLGFLIPAFYPKADSLPIFSFYRLLIFTSFLATTAGFISVTCNIFCDLRL